MAKILVVDDDKQIRWILCEVIKQIGHEVVEAENGKVALRHLHDAPIDIVITDIVMPEKEGLETIIEMKRDFPDVKIIAMSGGGQWGSHTYLELAEKFKVARTFEKPMNIPVLLSAIESLCTEMDSHA